MSKLEAEMAFEIGDIVYFRSSEHDDTRRPSKSLIVERCLHECHGGVQRMYRLDSSLDRLFPEIALTKELPPYDDTFRRLRLEAHDKALREQVKRSES